MAQPDAEHRQRGRLEEENRRIEAQLKNDKLKAELEAKNRKLKDDLLKLSVVGEYESKIGEHTDKLVLLENGISELYISGIKLREDKWSIVDGEIHFKYDSGGISVYRINTDKSITEFAFIGNGTRKDWPKEKQGTWKKIK